MEIKVYWDTAEGTKDADDVVYLVYGADAFLEFQRYSVTSDEFKGVNGAAGMVEFKEDGSGPDTYVYTDQWGYEFHFFGFDNDAAPAKGQIWKVVDPAEKVAYVGHSTDKDIALQGQVSPNIDRGYDANGMLVKAYDSEDRRFSYTYTSSLLTEVKAETKTSGTWGQSPSGVTEVAKVGYEYYIEADTHGSDNDLKLVELTVQLSDSGVSQTKKKYYRYYGDSTFNDSSHPGNDSEIKMIVDFEGTRNYDYAGDSTFDEDFIAETDANLESYSVVKLEYNSSGQVDVAFFNGECGCGGGGGDGEHTFEYEANGSYSDGTGYDTAWWQRTIVAKPGGSYLTQYFDEVGQSLHKVLTDADPDNTSPVPDRWVTEVTRNSNGVVTDISTPANITGYTHSSGAITTSTSAGLVWSYTLETTGDMTGFLLDTKHKTGTSGSAYYLRSVEHASGSVAPATDVTIVRPVMDVEKAYHTAKTSPAAADYDQTSHTFSFYSGELVVEEVDTTLPAVSTDNLGSGTSAVTQRRYTKQGRLEWSQDAGGAVHNQDWTSGVRGSTITDAASGDTPPAAWTVSTDAVSRDTTFGFDAQGRRKSTTQADGRVLLTYWSRLADHRLVQLSYGDFDEAASPDKFYGPVQFSVTNQAGKVEASGVVKLTSNETTTATTGHVDETDADPITAMDLGTVARLTTSIYGDSGTQRTESRPYFDIPASGAGTEGTNFDATYFDYDDEGQLDRTKGPSGTIHLTLFDTLGRVTSRQIGTNDADEAGADDMVTTELIEYDSDADDGNNLVTKRTLRVEATSTDERVTTYEHDVLGNVCVVNGPTSPHTLKLVDNRGRVTAAGLYSSVSGLDAGDDPTTQTGNRIALNQTFFNERGAVWKTIRHEIDVSDGSSDAELMARTWYDDEGQAIKRDGEQLTKSFYDRLGRGTHRFTLASDDDTVYADADDVSGDIVLVENQTTYESDDSDDVLMRATISRFHDDKGASETTGALDTNADTDDLLYTAANLEGRIQISASWYDRFGRVTDQVAYGTYGGSNFDRDGLSVPTRSDTALLTEYSYNTDGSRLNVTDPRDLETRTEYDDLGRQTAVIRNYVNGVPSSSTGDDDVFTRFVYTNGLRTKLWVDVDGDDVVDTGDQDTIYTYGTTKGATAGDSNIGTGHLLQKVQYPDSSGGTDVVTYAYNAQSQEIWRKDQAGNVIEKDYDDSGRLEHDRATTVDTDFDGDIKRISFGYDSSGRREKTTQYDNATVGSGTVQDEVQYTFDGWGNIEKVQQDNNSAVSGGGDDYELSYTFEKATTGRDTIRMATMTLPSTAGYTFQYSSLSNAHDEEASRVTRIKSGISPDPLTNYVRYYYNGLSTVVGREYPTVDIKQERFGGTSGSYPAFDRFDRIVEDVWVKDLATDVEIYDMDLTYDRNSNITVADEHVQTGFDVAYTLDGLDRLTDAQEGTWNGSSITSETRQQEWTLDQVGNWDVGKLDLNGDGDWSDTDEYNDDRTHNDVNELTGRDTDDNGTDDYTLVYDETGNLTDDGESYKYVYDVWYRLRKVNNQSDALVAEHWYNGLGHRITEHTDTDEDGDTDVNDDKHHFAYDERWRIVAMFVDTDTAPTEEVVHHWAGLSGRGDSSYIDEVALRQRDTDANGSLDETLWYCQNRHFDVVALIDSSGDQREMVRYSAYGVPFGLPGGDTDSDGDNDATDIAQIQTWIDASAYDVRADIDLDGDVDATDKSKASSSPLSGVTLGRGVLSGFANVRGYTGWIGDVGMPHWHARRRCLSSLLGRWVQRDPLEYLAGPHLSAALQNNPAAMVDPSGEFPLSTCKGKGKGKSSPDGTWVMGKAYLPNSSWYGCRVPAFIKCKSVEKCVFLFGGGRDAKLYDVDDAIVCCNGCCKWFKLPNNIPGWRPKECTACCKNGDEPTVDCSSGYDWYGDQSLTAAGGCLSFIELTLLLSASDCPRLFK